MSWHSLRTREEVEAVIKASHISPQVIFKHSTRCATSSVAHSRVERGMTKAAGLTFHIVDVIADRPVSQFIAERLHEVHESPQLLLLVNGEVKLLQNHIEVDMAEVVGVV
jgi:bacillithiol system protein YtxJ